MGWRFRRSKRFGPFRFSVTNRGITTSVGGGGLRYVLSSPGRRKRQQVQSARPVGVLAALFALAALGVFGFVGIAILAAVFGGATDEHSKLTVDEPKSNIANPIPLANSLQPRLDTPNVVPNATEVGTIGSQAAEAPDTPPPPLRDMRQWKSTNGKYSTNARLLEVIGNTAYLQKEAGGKIAAVDVKKLAEPNQQYIAIQRARHAIMGNVTGIISGDEIIVRGDREYHVRLIGIAAPQNAQPFGLESRQTLLRKVWQRSVEVEWTDGTDDGDILGQAILDGRWINKELVDEGWAWQHSGTAVLAESEEAARSQKLGLWAGMNPVPPWKYIPPAAPPARNVADDSITLDSFRSSSKPAAKAHSLQPVTSSPPAFHRTGDDEPITGHTATGIPIHTGPRGGHFHYSKSGKKVYERKKK